MICPKCKTEYLFGSKVCTDCGANLPQSKYDPSEIATLFSRVLSNAVDGVITFIIGFVLAYFISNTALWLCSFAVIIIVLFTVFETVFEGSVGKLIFGLRVCDTKGNPADVARIYLRNLIKFILLVLPLATAVLFPPVLVLFILEIIPIFGHKRQFVHDLAIKTITVHKPTKQK